MSAVLDIPMQLALVLMLALGQPAGEAREPGDMTVVAMRAAPANPLAFSRSSWLDAMGQMRADKRFARYAGRIFRTSSGEVYVPVERERREIEALRSDAMIARYVAEAFARANAAALKDVLGRAPAASDLYLAHLAGPRVAAQFRQQLGRDARAIAATALPELAEAVPALLFADDRALTLAEVATALDANLSRALKGTRSAHVPSTRVLGWTAEVRAHR